MAAPSTAFLCQLESHFAGTSDSDRWIISAAATSTALGYGQHWLPAIYHYACRNLRASPADSKPAPMIFANDTLPRRRLARKLKDVLMKSMLLAGVSRCIEASIALGDAVDPVDRAGDTGNYRSSLSIGDNASADRGKKGLLRVYRHQLGPISDRLSETGPEMNWLGTHITYGHFLEPCSDTNESAPLTFPETEIVVLSCHGNFHGTYAGLCVAAY